MRLDLVKTPITENVPKTVYQLPFTNQVQVKEDKVIQCCVSYSFFRLYIPYYEIKIQNEMILYFMLIDCLYY
jgi:hypothetical protein